MRRFPSKLKRFPLLMGSFWVMALIACVVVISTGRKASTDTHRSPTDQATSLKGVPQLIQTTKSVGAEFRTERLFEGSTSRAANDAALSKAVTDGTVLNLNRAGIQRILSNDVQFMTLPLTDERGGTIELELVKVNIFTSDFTVNVASTGAEVKGHLGAHYRGIIKGDATSLAAISVFENEVMGFYSTQGEGNRVVGRLQGDNPTDRHILYNDRDLKGRPDFDCAAEDTLEALPATKAPQPEVSETIAAACIRMYYETDYNIYTNKGSVTNVRNYVTGLFNQSATLYANDTIPVAMSQLVIWDVPSPYTPTTSNAMLTGFQSEKSGVFRGDTAHLLSLNSNLGGIAYVNVLCNRAFSYAYSGINATYQNVPTYSWSAMVITHEAGHNLASPHTHSCSWNGNNTAIDSCATTTGGCAAPGVPAGGGTIMSYCHLQSVGINFTLGFGPQPKALILQRFNAASCITDCAVAPTPKRAFDFDGDGRSDISLFRPSAGAWYGFLSTSGFMSFSFGNSTDTIAPADYDGDNRTDLGVFRSSTGTWYLMRTTLDFKGVSFGTAGDIPVPGDFDGDGLADISLFRPSNGGWYRINSGNGQAASMAFGQNGDHPLMGDFDGDGRADQAVFRPSTSSWYMMRSTQGFAGVQFGAAGDIPVPADYDGDGVTDVAVYRPSTGAWYLLRSQLGLASYSFGTPGDVPVPADYDGDGKSDIGVFRPSAAAWYLLRSTAGFYGQNFGVSTDEPVPAAFLP